MLLLMTKDEPEKTPCIGRELSKVRRKIREKSVKDVWLLFVIVIDWFKAI